MCNFRCRRCSAIHTSKIAGIAHLIRDHHGRCCSFVCVHVHNHVFVHRYLCSWIRVLCHVVGNKVKLVEILLHQSDCWRICAADGQIRKLHHDLGIITCVWRVSVRVRLRCSSCRMSRDTFGELLLHQRGRDSCKIGSFFVLCPLMRKTG